MALPVPKMAHAATSPTSTSTWLRRSLVTTIQWTVSRIALHRGLFEETLHPGRAVALAHIDSDWYQSVPDLPGTARIGPTCPRGGYIVLDDYYDYGGCRRAVDEFLASEPAFSIVGSSGSVTVQRLSTG